jgi:hypothetical protein
VSFFGAGRIDSWRAYQRVFYGWIAVCLALTVFLFRGWGPVGCLFLAIGGGFWIFLSKAIFPWLGLDPDADAIGNRNFAALSASGGAVFAVAATFAGGNIGEGPSILENVFSAGLGTGGLFVMWFALELGGGVSVSITEERDIASGVRFGGFMVAEGLILGRAVAGDWHSAWATARDFVRDGWGAVVVCAVAVAIEQRVKPTMEHPFPSWARCGMLPALIYLALAMVWLWRAGPWEGQP